MNSDEEITVNRYLSVIYADDLRQEIDGKITIVGMYSVQMLVPAFPIVLPKLAVLMTAVTPVEKPFGKFTLQLLKDDQVLLNIDAGTPEQENFPQGSDASGATTIELQFASVLSPLQLDGPCKLKARLTTPSGVIAGRPLIISAAPPAVSPSQAH